MRLPQYAAALAFARHGTSVQWKRVATDRRCSALSTVVPSLAAAGRAKSRRIGSGGNDFRVTIFAGGATAEAARPAQRRDWLWRRGLRLAAPAMRVPSWMAASVDGGGLGRLVEWLLRELES